MSWLNILPIFSRLMPREISEPVFSGQDLVLTEYQTDLIKGNRKKNMFSLQGVFPKMYSYTISAESFKWTYLIQLKIPSSLTFCGVLLSPLLSS